MVSCYGVIGSEARANIGCAVSITAAEQVVICAGGYIRIQVGRLEARFDGLISIVDAAEHAGHQKPSRILWCLLQMVISTLLLDMKPWQYVKHSAGDGHVELVA